jgi:undecaprenyl-diphosphatase
MFAATAYKLLKAYKETPEMLADSNNLMMLAVGNIVAFVVALAAIKFFIGYLSKYGFKLFGWYRIVVGLIIIGLIVAGVDLKIS